MENEQKQGRSRATDRVLPTRDIEGTSFSVDVEKLVLRESGNPHNEIPMENVREEFGLAVLHYDKRIKNLYQGNTRDPDAIPREHVSIVILPPLKELDPVGLARKKGLPEHYYTGSRRPNKSEKLPQLRRESLHGAPSPTVSDRHL